MTLQRRGNRESQLRQRDADADPKQDQNREFDDLISALRTGEVFSESFRCAKRKKKSPPSLARRESRYEESRERAIRIV